MAKIRISKAVQDEMEGTSIVQQPGELYTGGHNPALDAAARSLVDKIYAPSARKDGSVTADLTFDEGDVLYDYMSTWEIGAQDNVRDDPACLGQIVAARAVMKALVAAFGWEVAN